MFFGRNPEVRTVMFQHKIKAYRNIYMECVALHVKIHDGMIDALVR